MGGWGVAAAAAAAWRCFSSFARAWLSRRDRSCTIWCGINAFPSKAGGSPERPCTSVIVFLWDTCIVCSNTLVSTSFPCLFGSLSLDKTVFIPLSTKPHTRSSPKLPGVITSTRSAATAKGTGSFLVPVAIFFLPPLFVFFSPLSGGTAGGGRAGKAGSSLTFLPSSFFFVGESGGAALRVIHLCMQCRIERSRPLTRLWLLNMLQTSCQFWP